MNLIKLPAVLARTAYGRTTLYKQIEEGLMPPPVKLSENTIAFPESEINAIISARIAGKTPDEIRQLVAQLVADRQTKAV